MPEIEPLNKDLKSLSGLHLWHADMSSCSQRVRIAMAETGNDFESHIVDLKNNEHATPEYQQIHPDGLVPALVDNGRLVIESIDIIQHLAGPESDLFENASPELLEMAGKAQADLKLLTFEFLQRRAPLPSESAAAEFQKTHQNEKLKQFRIDFAEGFDPDRINQAIADTYQGFHHLNALLEDGRPYLSGEAFSLSDIAWMPNVHRFDLMGWPFDDMPHLASWFQRVKERPSYQNALVKWQNENAVSSFGSYTAKRKSEGTDITSFPFFKELGRNA